MRMQTNLKCCQYLKTNALHLYLDIQEIGPYAYDSKHEKRVIGWQDTAGPNGEQYDDNLVKFQHRTIYTQSQDDSSLNDENDYILVPNLVLMSGMLKSEVQELPTFIKQSVVWNMLSYSERNSPILRITVREFLWGYEVFIDYI